MCVTFSRAPRDNLSIVFSSIGHVGGNLVSSMQQQLCSPSAAVLCLSAAVESLRMPVLPKLHKTNISQVLPSGKKVRAIQASHPDIQKLVLDLANLY
jgi:hypothetical protein